MSHGGFCLGRRCGAAIFAGLLLISWPAIAAPFGVAIVGTGLSDNGDQDVTSERAALPNGAGRRMNATTMEFVRPSIRRKLVAAQARCASSGGVPIYRR